MDASQCHDLPGQIATVIQRALPDVMAVYVFGSTARGDERRDSDVDIAVLLPPGQRLSGKLALAARLHNTTGREVDIVDLRQANNFLRMEVLRQGRQVLNADPERVLAWEGRAMGEYAQHRTAIQDIMRDFRHTGVGYHR